MSKMNFIWIDDDPERADNAATLQEALEINCSFIDLKSNSDVMKEVLQGEEPALILIDHNLQDISSGDFRKGSTVAAFIRETWLECPIICITGEDLETVDSNKRDQYEEIIPINKISDYYSILQSIADTFHILQKKRPKTVADLLSLIAPPAIEADRLTAIMPNEIKENFTDNSLLLEICHWVRKTLVNRPGFLYNQLWVSTLLGVKEESFYKIAELFEPAEYQGIFYSAQTKRWWKSKVLAILYDIVEVEGLPWEKGRNLPGLNPGDFSVCYASNAPFPETVAFVDETKSAVAVPMKLQHTITHPNYDGLLFFEELRMMKPAE